MAEPQKTQQATQGARPGTKSPAKRLVHRGFLVASPIRYATPEGVVKSAGVGSIIDDLTEEDRVQFEGKGLIQPHFAAEEAS